jgi:antitoxin (DNA-binding transcriptional repressor) of toxin-antitoxin stability system
MARVGKGEEILNTRNEKLVARMIPEGRLSQNQTVAAVAGLRELRQSIANQTGRKSKLTLAQVKDLIDQGRR